MALFPRLTYPGINPLSVRSAAYSISHGIVPGVLTVEVPAGSGLPDKEGTAVLALGATQLELRGCRTDLGNSRVGVGSWWTFSILDFRWRWEYGYINGHYNLRRADGSLRDDTERSPQELATLCLRRLSVSQYDISDMPQDSRPETHWSWTNPAQALLQLCDAVGCRIVPKPDGSVAIRITGQGADLPQDLAVSGGPGLDSGNIPSGVLVVGGESLFQARWELEAVGRDVDGKIKPIDDLSYKPPEGWEFEAPSMLSGVASNDSRDRDDDPRALALQTVFRWYRIKKMVGGDDLPGLRRTRVESYKECLPLAGGLLEMYSDDDGKTLKRRPAVVRGRFYDDQFSWEDQENAVFAGDFQTENSLGVVQFSRPVYRSEGDEIKPAELTLETAFSWRKPDDDDQPHRPSWRFPVQPRPDVGDKVLVKEEVQFTARWEYSGTSRRRSVDNLQSDRLEQQARYFASVFVASLQDVQSDDRQYAGLRLISLDGAIAQVSWTIGNGAPATRASRNSEHDTDVYPTYAKRQSGVTLGRLKDILDREQAGKDRGGKPQGIRRGD